jgi:hypothetical protein
MAMMEFKQNKWMLVYSFFIILTALLTACNGQKTEEYIVNKIDSGITVDGDLSEPAWNTANIIEDFVYPWKPAHSQPTTFMALHDGDFLYLAYRMVDDVIIAPDLVSGEQDLIEQDRVEIYVAPDKMISDYYCIEMDVKGRKLDYRGKYHRQFDFFWEFNDVTHKGTYTDDGYQIEAAISLQALDDLGVVKDGVLYAGIYRADFHYDHDSSVIHVYATWIDPKVEEPDFHIPASLGIFCLE